MFLEPKHLAKLAIFKSLLFSEEPVLISSIATDLGISRKTLLRYLDQLIADILHYFPDFDLRFKINHGKIIIFTIEEETALYLLSYMRLSYIEETKEFKMIHLLLDRKIKNVTTLGKELHQSPSSVYLTLKKVTYLLDHFDIQLDFSTHNRISNFVYEEKKLRLFAYYFYGLTYGGIKWPTDWKENHWAQPLLGKTQKHLISQLVPSKQNQLHYIGMIWYRRLLLRIQPIQMDEPYRTIIATMTSIHDLTETYLSLPLGIDTTYQEDEHLFINIFLRHLVGDIDTATQQIEMMAQLVTLDNPISNFCQSLLSNLIKEFSLISSEETHAFFFYHLILFFIYIQYYDINLPSSFFSEIVFEKQPPRAELNTQIRYFLTDFFIKDPLGETFKLTDFYLNLLVSQIYTYIDMSTAHPLRIATQFSKNALGEELIKQRLRKVYTSQVVVFTKDYQQADLVISESYEGLKKEKDYFYIDSLTDNAAWSRLFNYIQERILDRNF